MPECSHIFEMPLKRLGVVPDKYHLYSSMPDTVNDTQNNSQIYQNKALKRYKIITISHLYLLHRKIKLWRDVISAGSGVYAVVTAGVYGDFITCVARQRDIHGAVMECKVSICG